MKDCQNVINRSELVDQLASKQYCLPELIDATVKVILSEISTALSEQQRVEIRGFGHFEIRQYSAQTRLNPKTGQTVQVPSRRSVHFTAGKQLKAQVDQHEQK